MTAQLPSVRPSNTCLCTAAPVASSHSRGEVMTEASTVHRCPCCYRPSAGSVLHPMTTSGSVVRTGLLPAGLRLTTFTRRGRRPDSEAEEAPRTLTVRDGLSVPSGCLLAERKRVSTEVLGQPVPGAVMASGPQLQPSFWGKCHILLLITPVVRSTCLSAHCSSQVVCLGKSTQCTPPIGNKQQRPALH